MKKPGLEFMAMLDRQYQVSPVALQMVGALILMWGKLELELEKAIWRLSGETPYGKIPTTDKMPTGQRIVRFSEIAMRYHGPEWQEIVGLITRVSENMAAYRNAIVHGLLFPASVGGGTVNNYAWYGERRSRPPMRAHLDENLVGLMLDALHEVLVVLRLIAEGDIAPNVDGAIFKRRHLLKKAESHTNEVRYLADFVNSERY